MRLSRSGASKNSIAGAIRIVVNKEITHRAVRILLILGDDPAVCGEHTRNACRTKSRISEIKKAGMTPVLERISIRVAKSQSARTAAQARENAPSSRTLATSCDITAQ